MRINDFKNKGLQIKNKILNNENFYVPYPVIIQPDNTPYVKSGIARLMPIQTKKR